MSSKRARELLTLDRSLEFVSISEQISEYELGSYYTLSPHDIEIIKRHRRDHNKLGLLSLWGNLVLTLDKTALREMGRIEKTIFILDYISSETLRRKIHRGLNKGEAMNSLARSIFFGKRGELCERALQDQLQRASALNIIINVISIWNTVYLT